MSSVAERAMMMWQEVGRLFRRFTPYANQEHGSHGPLWRASQYELGPSDVQQLRRDLERIGKVRPTASGLHDFDFRIMFRIPKEFQRTFTAPHPDDSHPTARAVVTVRGWHGSFVARVRINHNWISSIAPSSRFATVVNMVDWENATEREIFRDGVSNISRTQGGLYPNTDDGNSAFGDLYVALWLSQSRGWKHTPPGSPIKHVSEYGIDGVEDIGDIWWWRDWLRYDAAQKSKVVVKADAPGAWWTAIPMRTPFGGKMRPMGSHLTLGVGAQEEQVVVELESIAQTSALPSSIAQVLIKSL